MIVKVIKNENYSVLCNDIFKHKYSARAVGIYCYLMSLPNDWKVHKSEIESKFSEGTTAFSTAWKELENAGYITKVRVRNKNRFNGWDYTIRELPYV